MRKSSLLQDNVQPPLSVSPLSYGQQALWLTYRLAPESWAYHVLFSARICSAVDMPALHRAFQELLNRHASLRTTYVVRDGTPAQQVHAHLPVSFEVVDVSGWGREALYDHLCAEARRPFDLTSGPLMRVHVCTRSASEHVLLFTVHHIALDLWSLGLLLHDLRLLYAAAQAGGPATLPPLELQYTDYVRWQTDMLASAATEAHWAYWQQQLAGELPDLHLPYDRPRPPVQTYQGSWHAFQLTATLTQQLKALARAEGVTLYMLLLAAFYVVLYRYSGQEDILIGTFTADRLRPEFRRIVGYFTNPVVLRASMAGNPSFKAFLSQVRATVLAALKHQALPFPLLVERLRPPRAASRSPLFQVAFVLQQLPQQAELLPYFVPGAPGEPLDFGGLRLAPFVLPQQEGQFDLTLEVAEVGPSFYGGLKYNPDLFDAATMARLAEHWRTLLASIVAHPAQPLAELSLLSAVERQQVLHDWNRTTTAAAVQGCIQTLFERQVERTPDAIAVVCGAEQLTYHELNQRANQVAHHLQGLGVGPEVLVGVCVERSLHLLVGVLGILKAGGAYVPLDPAYPQERLTFILQDAQVPVLVTQQRLRERLPEHTARRVYLDADWSSMARQSVHNPQSGVLAHNLAYVIYTSGSTGRPKGVAIAHGNAAALLFWASEVFTPEEYASVLASTSLCFDLSVFELFMPLSQGGTVVLADNLLQLASLPAASHVTLINTVPSVLTALLKIAPLPASVRTVNLAGEPLHTSLVKHVYAYAGVQQVFDLYGPSEDTTYSTFARRSPTGPATIGRPITNTQVYLLDAQLQPVPVAVPGEVHLAGAGLARGYLNRAALTAEKFIPNPFSDEPGARLYRTGDMARYRPDGNLAFLGRADSQVKVRGFRVELGEIEAVLSQHPAVRETAVTAWEEGPYSTSLVAYVVPTRQPAPASAALRDFLQGTLPDYMVPSAFVLLDALPVTPSGKVDRRALPAPGSGHFGAQEAPATAPRTPLEQTLVEIWRQVLPVKEVGIHDNFFTVGGHSLLAVQLISLVQQACGRTLPLSALLQAPTIAEFAVLLEQHPEFAAPVLVPMQRQGSQPLLFCLHPAGGQVMVYQHLVAALGPDQPVYGLQSRALSGTTPEHPSLRAMASDYAAAMRQQQSEGPYYLAGWSLGGVLAVATAGELEQQGQCVASVCLFDAAMLTSHDLPQYYDPLLVLLVSSGGDMAQALAALGAVERQALHEELLALAPPQRWQRLQAWGRARQLFTAAMSPVIMQQQAALVESHLALLRAHTVTPIQAPLYIWWSRASLEEGRLPSQWHRYALGGMHVEMLACNHFSMMQPPAVQAVAQQLSTCLQAVQGKLLPTI